jgi:cysteine-rich repeat protein
MNHRPSSVLAWLACFGLLSTCVVSMPASAHDALLPISGAGVTVQGEPAVPSGNEVFSFSSMDPNILVDQTHTPALVRGEGANAGRTPLIALDPTKWSAEVSGFSYDDPAGGADGITSVVFDDGILSISGAGMGWPWSPAGAQDAVWVHFRIEDEWFCAEFPGVGASVNVAGDFQSGAASAPVTCPEEVCGNGVVEGLEACDDGNLVEDDGCTSVCEVGECSAQEFASTFEAIQSVVFESPVYGCTTVGCHDTSTAFLAGNLDLTAGVSHEQLLGVDGLGGASDGSEMRRVEPLDPQLSFLYRKLASKLDPDLPEIPLAPLAPPLGEGDPMPRSPFFPLLPDHLEAIRIWIRNAAPEDTVVDGTQALLGACLAEPDPQKIPVPAPPPVDMASGDLTGVQLQQTPWPLFGRTPETQGEDEICMATYYDLSDLVPESAKVPCPDRFQQRQGVCSNDVQSVCSQDGDCGAGNTCRGRCSRKTDRLCDDDADCLPQNAGVCNPVKNATNIGNECFAWNRQVLRQDPQSHHSIISIYTGAADASNPSWGVWSRKSDDPADPCYPVHWPDPNSPPVECLCDPTAVDTALGYSPDCSGEIESSVACIGYGPADASNFNFAGGGGNFPQFSGSQEPIYDFQLADGVFTTLPLRGIVNWNSHAFNLSSQDSTLAQYLNLYFAGPEDQQAPLRGIFDAQWIFAQNVLPFETSEICATHTLPQGARLFQLSSHTHVRGVEWRTWLPPNTPCQPRCPTDETGENATCVLVGSPFEFCGCENVFSCAAEPQRGCLADEHCAQGDTCDLDQPVVPWCDDLGYPREDTPLYRNLEYSDPLSLNFDPPLEFDSEDPLERTLLFCSEYDNGSTARAPLKLQSTAPVPPPVLGIDNPAAFEAAIGGPCPDALRYCVSGVNRGLRCGDQADPHGFCGDPVDELCDACPVHGGVTTGDEMFILLGSYFMAPEPSQILLGLAALASVGWVARRRRA